MTLTAHNLTIQLNGNPILNGVDVQIVPGEFVTIIGANGAGKSTLLRALCGELRPTNGTISMGDKPLQAWPLRQQARVRAVLPQNSTLTFHFSALEVVLMGRTPHVDIRESARDMEIAWAALARAEADTLARRIFTTLSGGEQQRVMLARVLAQIWEAPEDDAPRYLLMDEPTNHLDLNHQHRILDVARRMSRDRVAVLTVLHDLNLAAQYADRVLVLHQGRVLVDAPPRAALTPDTIATAFDIRVKILDHPDADCPLVVALPISV